MKDYTVKSETAVFSDTMKITETTDSNHASNINAGPMCAFENTIAIAGTSQKFKMLKRSWRSMNRTAA